MVSQQIVLFFISKTRQAIVPLVGIFFLFICVMREIFLDHLLNKLKKIHTPPPCIQLSAF